jgi:hypothetical protein
MYSGKEIEGDDGAGFVEWWAGHERGKVVPCEWCELAM